MSLYLVVMVMFNLISLIPRLQFIVEIVKKSCCTSAVLNGDDLMAPFWGCYGCMSLYLVAVVMFNIKLLY